MLLPASRNRAQARNLLRAGCTSARRNRAARSLTAPTGVEDRGSDGPLADARGSDGAPEGQYFEGVPPEVWNFHIGGYQVCEKWLKDRRGRTLTYEDLEHYAKVATALQETIRLMASIDAAIPRWPLE